jgi:hypothetical protein
LITAISEVLYDMQVFLFILFTATIAFSGCFYILSRNNTTSKSFIKSVMETY